MNINLKDCVKLHNRYELELKDAATGEVKQRAHAENVVLDRIWSLWTSYINVRMFGAVAMGTGSGTPASTDTDMFNRAFIGPRSGTSGDYMTLVSKNEAYPTCTYTFKCDIPATSSYTGNLTEVGLIATNNNSGNIAIGGLWSHAMLQDAEGQAITINKTDLDVLTVTATVYVTFSSTDSNFMWIAPGPNNAICKVFAATEMNAIAPFAASQYKMHHCTSVLTDDNCIVQFTSASAARVGSPTFNLSTMILNVPTARLESSVGNNTYYKGLILSTDSSTVSGLGGVVYPNVSVFPNQEITGMRVGTGDGVTTDYALPINLIVQGTDKVYVNDVLQQRGVDYTIDNANTTMADGTALSLMLIEDEPESDTEIPDVPDYISLGVYAGKAPGFVYGTDACVAASTEKPFTIENCRQGALNTAKPLVYKLLDSACGKLNKISIESVFPTAVNIASEEATGCIQKGVCYSSPFAVYDSTADMTIPDLGSFASFNAAALGILAEVFEEGTEYAEITDNFKFVKRERGVGKSNVIYRMCKYNPGNAYLANVQIDDNFYPWLVSVADPSIASGPETLSYEFSNDSDYYTSGSVSYTPPRIEDISFLDDYEDIWPSATTINGKCIDYVDSSGTEVIVRIGSGYKSYSIPITPGHSYFIEATSPGDVAYMVATDLNLATATESGWQPANNMLVHNGVQAVNDREFFVAPAYATYLTIYASDNNQEAVYSIKDVTNLSSKIKFKLAPKAYTTYYKAYRIIDDACPIGWTHEVIPNAATANSIYSGLKVKITGSSDGASWVPIKTFTLGNANANTYRGYVGSFEYYSMRVHTGLSYDCSTCNYSYYRIELDAAEAVHPQISDVDALLVAPNFAASVFNMVLYDDEVYESGTYDTVTAGTFLLYEGNGISFTNPPAAGAIIKMDGKIDRPYKNSNFVIDAAMSIHFGDA